MKLLASLTSPFARKVRVVLAEKRIEYDFEEDVPWEESTRVPQFNPLGKVPVLVLDDGSTLFDSRVIVEYLDLISPVSRLYPDTGRQRIQVKRWEALADGVSEAAANIFLELKRPKSKQSQDWVDRQKSKVEAGLKALSMDLGERPWCSGENYSVADVALGCCLGYLDFRFPSTDWRTAYPNLGRMAEKLGQRQSFKDTMPPSA